MCRHLSSVKNGCRLFFCFVKVFVLALSAWSDHSISITECQYDASVFMLYYTHKVLELKLFHKITEYLFTTLFSRGAFDNVYKDYTTYQ